jgi:hypothetical protein
MECDVELKMGIAGRSTISFCDSETLSLKPDETE